MELFRPRSSSIPRHLRQLPAHERFTVTDAAQLKLKLQALDDKLEPGVDADALKNACQPRPFHEEIYVAGSEEFYLLVKSIGRADLIPDVYIEAYNTVQHGRFPINQYRVSDFRKGVDPTFSEVRLLLPKIDDMCGTKLNEAFRTLENAVEPFSFLALPAELRLQVYSNLLPREAHIAIMHQPSRDTKPPRITLDIMRVNHQLHKEVTKYFYEGRTLFMSAARDKFSKTLSDEYISRYYETVAVMSPLARKLFAKMEIQIGYLSEQTFFGRKYQHIKSVPDPVQQIFKLLPGIATVVLSVRSLPNNMRRTTGHWFSQRPETLGWLVDAIPQEVNIQWTRVGPMMPQDRLEEDEMKPLLAVRGPIQPGNSVLTTLSVARNDEKKKFYNFPSIS